MRFSTIAFLIVTTSSLPALAQSTPNCDVPGKIGGKYRIFDASVSTVEGRRVVFLKIGLKASRFNDEDLRKVARRLNATYCGERIVNVEILDSSDKQKYDDLTPPPIFAPQTRALYLLDRDAKIERLRYYRDRKEGPAISLTDQ